MTRHYRRRRRKLRAGTILVLLLAVSLLLVSCVAGSNLLWVRSLFGADIASYRSEPVIATHPSDGDIAQELCDALELLTSGSVYLKEFRTVSQAVRIYRDEILNALVRTNYASYVGDPTLTQTVGKAYPYLTAAVLIPEADFESAVSRYLGASTVSNRSGEHFTYLSKADCYTAPMQAKALSVTIEADAPQETEHTYRMHFTLTDSDGNSAAYSALYIKRTDGPAYLRALSCESD